MRKFLGQNKRIVFTLIQKFRWDRASERIRSFRTRSDIIVIVDEAHRTQYKSLAENMRKGLPKAQYLAFTGTPLLGRERKTNAWFGDYVSEYNFQQSMDDGATVPLFYEKRVPEVLIQNEDLSEEFYEILEDENLDEAQQAKLERVCHGTGGHQARRPAGQNRAGHRLSLPRRGYLGKGMVVAVDKFTAVKMYDKVQAQWKDRPEGTGRAYRQVGQRHREGAAEKIVEYMRGWKWRWSSAENADEGEIRRAEAGHQAAPRAHEPSWMRMGTTSSTTSRTRSIRCNWCSSAPCG
jgi:type I restriction enzyme R subunit